MWPNLRKPTMYCKTFLWVVGGLSWISVAVAKIIFLRQRGGARISKLPTKFDGWSSFVCRDMTPRRQTGRSSLLLLPLKYGDALLGWLIRAYKKTWLMTAALRIWFSLSTLKLNKISLLDLLHGYLDDGSDDETLESSGSDVSHSWSCSPTQQATETSPGLFMQLQIKNLRNLNACLIILMFCFHCKRWQCCRTLWVQHWFLTGQFNYNFCRTPWWWQSGYLWRW